MGEKEENPEYWTGQVENVGGTSGLSDLPSAEAEGFSSEMLLTWVGAGVVFSLQESHLGPI